MHWIFITYTETKVIEDRVIVEKQKKKWEIYVIQKNPLKMHILKTHVLFP